MIEQLSEIFDSKTQLPWEPGVYKTNFALKNDKFTTYQYWNGIFWGYYSPDIKGAYSAREWQSECQKPKWQGLAKCPTI